MKILSASLLLLSLLNCDSNFKSSITSDNQSVLGYPCAKHDTINLNHWEEHEFPNDWKKLTKANHSNEEWMVCLNEGGQARGVKWPFRDIFLTRPYKYPEKFKAILVKNYGDRYNKPVPIHDYIKVKNGWISGRNAGEWGGGLYFISTDGKSHYHISDDQIKQFFQYGNRIFAVEGLAHLGLSE